MKQSKNDWPSNLHCWVILATLQFSCTVCHACITKKWIQNARLVSLAGMGAFVWETRPEIQFPFGNINTVFCSFQDDEHLIKEDGWISNAGIVCKLPLFKALGTTNITVSVNITRTGYSQTVEHTFPLIVVKNEDLNKIVYLVAKRSESENVSIDASWSTTAFSLDEVILGTAAKRSLALVALKRLPDFGWQETILDITDLNGLSISLTSNWTFSISQSSLLNALRPLPNSIFGVRYQVNLENGKSVAEQLVANVGFEEDLLRILQTGPEYFVESTSKCETWYKESIPTILNSKDFNRFSGTCPETAEKAMQDFRLAQDYTAGNYFKDLGPIILFTAVVPEGHTNFAARCFYNQSTYKVLKSLSSSHLAYYRPNFTKYWHPHYSTNFLPYEYCCSGSDHKTEVCLEYIYDQAKNLFPHINYTEPEISAIYGFGHVMPFGQSSTFTINGVVGYVRLIKYEHTLVNYTFEVQGKLFPFQEGLSTILKAISIRDSSSGKILQIECFAGENTTLLCVLADSNAKLFVKFASHHLLYLKGTVFYHDNLHIRNGGNGSVVIVFKSGFSMQILPRRDRLSVFVQQSVISSNNVTLRTGYMFQDTQSWIRGRISNINAHMVPDEEKIFLLDLELVPARSYVILPKDESLDVELAECDGVEDCLFDYKLSQQESFALETKQDYSFSKSHLSALSEKENSPKFTYEHSEVVNETNFKQEEMESNFTYVYIGVGSFVGVSFIVALIVFVRKYLPSHCQHRAFRYYAGLVGDQFYTGAVDAIDWASNVATQADALPFDQKWEFPLEKLKLGKKLGSGAFGQVVEAEATDILEPGIKTTVAVKTASPSADNENLKALISELKVMANLGSHLNLVNLLGATTDLLNSTGKLYLILEYCGKGNLRDYLLRHRTQFQNAFNLMEGKSRPSSEASSTTDQILFWGIQIARGMEFLSVARVLHGDLAARNVLLTSDLVAKVCDFGFSKHLNKAFNYNYKKDLNKQVLPYKWMALESMTCGIFSCKSDCWSYGVLLWEMFSLGEIPYIGMTVDIAFVTSIRNGYRMEKPKYAPSRIYDVMLQCWREDPSLRPQFRDIAQSFEEILGSEYKECYVRLGAEFAQKMGNRIHDTSEYLMQMKKDEIQADDPRGSNEYSETTI